MRGSRLAYISFDIVPAPKGASTHIQAFARSLADVFGGIELVTVAEGEPPDYPQERWPNVFHTELPGDGPTLIDRVLCFRRHLARWLRNKSFEAIQFRSIFEGLPLVDLAARSRLIFEVNGLPSIELKYRYPGVEDDRELMRKIAVQERACLRAADLVITPSGVTRRYLMSAYEVLPEKVRVIPNGVDVEMFSPAAIRPPGFKLLYFGTLSSWQGVELGIRALAHVRDHAPAELTIIGAGSFSERDTLLNLAQKLNIASFVTVLPPLPQSVLAGHLRISNAVLAPLTLNDRNVVQGCCPLKILESMAAGVPVISSDLPVVRELGCDGVHFLLVKPGSVDQNSASLSAPVSRPSAGARHRRSRARTHPRELHLEAFRRSARASLRRTWNKPPQNGLKRAAFLSEAEIPEHMLACGQPNPLPLIGRTRQPIQHYATQTVQLPAANDNAGQPVLNDFRNSARIAPDHEAAGGHGLQQSVRHSIPKRRLQIDITELQVRVHFCGRSELACNQNPMFLESSRAGPLHQSWQLRWPHLTD